MDDLTIIPTADGSHSLMNTALRETYHSVHGAVQESAYVFLKQGLEFRLQQEPQKEIRILEVGFGTGLNALLTLSYATEHQIPLYYESWEMYPLKSAIVQQLNYGTMTGLEDSFKKIHSVAWE